MVRRTQAEDFLSLLDRLDLPNEDHKMADNYFSILGNVLPERWFYVENELGGGQPFTVGEAGDERNDRHIVRRFLHHWTNTHTTLETCWDPA